VRDCHKKGAVYKDAPAPASAATARTTTARRATRARYGEKCESCHGAKAWKPITFNHDNDTKYLLRGKHRSGEVRRLPHRPPVSATSSAAPASACHKKDDKHKGSAGPNAACHTERGWKENGQVRPRQDRFPLLGKHVQTEVRRLPQEHQLPRDAPSDCIGCHKKDDKHEATLGTKCESCHGERDWKTVTRFNHDDTKFKLRNAHAAKTVQCKACHADLKSYRNTPRDCYSAATRRTTSTRASSASVARAATATATGRPPRFDHATRVSRWSGGTWP
jgi:hypothetical protein